MRFWRPGLRAYLLAACISYSKRPQRGERGRISGFAPAFILHAASCAQAVHNDYTPPTKLHLDAGELHLDAGKLSTQRLHLDAGVLRRAIHLSPATFDPETPSFPRPGPPRSVVRVYNGSETVSRKGPSRRDARPSVDGSGTHPNPPIRTMRWTWMPSRRPAPQKSEGLASLVA